MRRPYHLLLLICSASIVMAPGCGKAPPAITEVEGIVVLGGKPLPNALIEFQPELDLGPEWISTGITDKNGKFKLNLEQKQLSGAAVCMHRVLVRESPPPAEARGMGADSEKKLKEYQEGLVNRPIPKEYASAGTTKAKVEVKMDQHDYKIELPR